MKQGRHRSAIVTVIAGTTFVSYSSASEKKRELEVNLALLRSQIVLLQGKLPAWRRTRWP
jgi:hypothetical protein